jgi:H+-transporting ATPase
MTQRMRVAALSALPGKSTNSAVVDLQNGLTGDEACRRLGKFGPNAMPDTAVHPLRRALTKLWAPVPWMLEAAIVLQIVLGDYAEAAIITGWYSTLHSDCSRRAALRRRLLR